MKLSHLSHALLCLMLATGAACKGEADDKATAEVSVEAAVGADAVVEEHDGGTVAWDVAPDGNVKAAVSGPDGKLLTEDVSGSLVWRTGGATKTVPLELDAKTGLLVGAGPKLEGDLSEIRYSLKVQGKPWTGTLHLPAGGTAELVASARAAADIEVAADAVGPHGGVVQVVGKDRFELVADEVTGEVRVYLLDADLKAVAAGDMDVTLGVVAEAPQIIVLTAAEGRAYFKGKWSLKADPLKVTIAVRTPAGVSVALVGFRAGAHVAVTARAPRIKARVKTDWGAHVDVDPDVDIHADVKAKGGVKVKAKVSGPDVNVKVKTPKPPKLRAKAHAGASVGFH